jgi:hypothetical protein
MTDRMILLLTFPAPAIGWKDIFLFFTAVVTRVAISAQRQKFRFNVPVLAGSGAASGSSSGSGLHMTAKLLDSELIFLFPISTIKAHLEGPKIHSRRMSEVITT